MAFSDWMKNNYKWLIAAIVIPLICAIVVPIYLSKSPNPPANINQTSNTTGDNNTSTQISNSPGATVVNNNIDPEA
ncbi:MAG: long-chain fatty acid--CoA ligase, partial [Candidatus Scalindua sp.]|nr:long-chain fatty acid--CoA ligase [Candidatus Scalindua sp.]